jgi:3-dehydroquinate dehydratase/shikimate dehydrogenase
LGSGGVGKAIAVGLLARGAQVALTDGNDQRAVELAARLKCRPVPWAERYAVPAEILVNATPLGMHPKIQETPYDKQRLRAGMVVFDVVYNPECTQLLLDAQSRDCKTVSGLDMFVRQACLQFKLFTGQEGPAGLMREVLKKALSSP